VLPWSAALMQPLHDVTSSRPVVRPSRAGQLEREFGINGGKEERARSWPERGGNIRKYIGELLRRWAARRLGEATAMRGLCWVPPWDQQRQLSVSSTVTVQYSAHCRQDLLSRSRCSIHHRRTRGADRGRERAPGQLLYGSSERHWRDLQPSTDARAAALALGRDQRAH
jgi:hypothetical protein